MNNNQALVISERDNLHKHRVDKNRLLCASFLNVLTFFCAIFSMAYYQWINISFAVNVRQPHQNTTIVVMYANLLYGYYNGKYMSYGELQELICPRDDTFCLAILYELDFTGKLCFSIFLFAFLISGYDCVRIIKFALGEITTKSKFFIEKSSVMNFKNNFRNILMIFTYAVGLSLDYFAINIIPLEQASYGVSFWVFVSSLLLFVIVSIWENRKMSILSKQELVIMLLQKQKQALRESKSDGSYSNNSSQIFAI